jgi:hypothetical protein
MNACAQCGYANVSVKSDPQTRNSSKKSPSRQCSNCSPSNCFFFLSPMAPPSPDSHSCVFITNTKVRLGGSIVNLSEFYSYRLIGKLTAFLELQEFSQRNQIWEHSSTFAARLSLRYLNHVSHRFSPKLWLYVLTLT